MNTHDQFVKEQAKGFLNRLKDEKNWGVPVDIKNINSVVVAAYWMGYADAELQREMKNKASK